MSEQTNRRVGGIALAAGLLLIGVNLRMGVAAVGPVLSAIRADTGLSATAAGLLTTIPVSAFGAFAFLTPALTRRFGMHRLLGAAVLVLAAGIALRLQPSLAALFGGTVVVGAAIAVANVLMPATIKHDFAHRVGLMMGLYSTTLYAGAALSSGLIVPLMSALGGHWRPALAFWAIPAVLAALLWLPQLGRDSAPSGNPDAAAGPSFRAVLTDPVALSITAFMGLQSTSYYATLAWIPTILTDHGADAHTAGWLLSYSSFPGIAASLVTPALARRARPAWLPVALTVVLTGAGYLGLGLDARGGAYAWMTLLGLGQGISIALGLSYIVWRSPDSRHTGHVSTMVQGFGYLFAGLGPLLVGALHSASGGWSVPLAALAVLLVFQLVAGVSASRDRQVGHGPPEPSTVAQSGRFGRA